MRGIDRFVVLGLARPRTQWSIDLGRWAASATLPIEFVRCVSVDEVRSRLESDHRHSALLIDERMLGVDRELLGAARSASCAAFVVSDSPGRRDWRTLGASAVLTDPVDPDELMTALTDHAPAVVDHIEFAATDEPTRNDDLGRLVVVTGAGGTGRSMTAMALAGDLARRSGHDAPIALIDACRNADQALLHDLGDVVPGLQELVELHRSTNPDDPTVRSHLWYCPLHGYDVLPGLRRHRDWSTLRRRSTLAALASVRRAYPLVIADADPDLEGERETGSIDVEERNQMSRQLIDDADVVVLTARPAPAGIARLVRSIAELLDHDIEIERLCPVIVGAPRSRRDRSLLSHAIRDLLHELDPRHLVPTPVMVPIRRDVDAAIIDTGSPSITIGAVSQAVASLLDLLPPRIPSSHEPMAVIPGHLGLTA